MQGHTYNYIIQLLVPIILPSVITFKNHGYVYVIPTYSVQRQHQVQFTQLLLSPHSNKLFRHIESSGHAVAVQTSTSSGSQQNKTRRKRTSRKKQLFLFYNYYNMDFILYLYRKPFSIIMAYILLLNIHLLTIFHYSHSFTQNGSGGVMSCKCIWHKFEW